MCVLADNHVEPARATWPLGVVRPGRAEELELVAYRRLIAGKQDAPIALDRIIGVGVRHRGPEWKGSAQDPTVERCVAPTHVVGGLAGVDFADVSGQWAGQPQRIRGRPRPVPPAPRQQAASTWRRRRTRSRCWPTGRLPVPRRRGQATGTRVPHWASDPPGETPAIRR